MSNRQERAAKRRKRADAKADVIIETTKAAVATATPPTRVAGCSDEEYDLALRVKALRDEGEAWWAIARALELPGAGDSASTGKKGAAAARKAYAKGLGSHPRTFTRGQGRTRREKNEAVREVQRTTRRSRADKVMAGEGVIDPDISNEDLAAMLKGRKISWMIVGDYAPEGLEQEAWIHPKMPLYIEGEGADRVIEFREVHKHAPIEFRLVPAHTRTVRLSRIFSVKGGH